MVRHFQYIGDRLETSLFGLRFQSGRATAVNTATINPKHLAKLMGNPEFSEVTDAPGDADGAGVAWRADGYAPVQISTHDVPAASQQESDEIELLHQEADTLGLKIDARWGLARLRAEVEKVRG